MAARRGRLRPSVALCGSLAICGVGADLCVRPHLPLDWDRCVDVRQTPEFADRPPTYRWPHAEVDSDHPVPLLAFLATYGVGADLCVRPHLPLD